MFFCLHENSKLTPAALVRSQMSRKEIMKQIGRLFLLRVNISLVGSMIDSPVRPLHSLSFYRAYVALMRFGGFYRNSFGRSLIWNLSMELSRRTSRSRRG